VRRSSWLQLTYALASPATWGTGAHLPRLPT